MFSFGSFIYELITQELPFQKLGGGQADQMIAEGKRPRLAAAVSFAVIFEGFEGLSSYLCIINLIFKYLFQNQC